jgi:transposase
MADDTVSWFAAVDWGSAQHQACVLDRGGAVVGERAFPHGGAGLAALCDWLVSIAGDAGAVAVAIEVPHGPVVDALLDRGFAVHAINPKRLDRLRDRFSVAGAKDDRRDARVAAAGLRTDPHLFRPVQASDPAVVELREWSRLAEELQQERVRLGNRVRQQLWRYYPQLLELADDVAAEWVLALWAMAPTPAKAARLREATLARLLKRHRIRRVDAGTALGILRRPAIKVAAGVTEAAVLHLRSLVVRLRLANREFRQAERKLDELCAALGKEAPDVEDAKPRDAAILASLPGVGRSTLATLLTEAAGPLGRRDHAALRTLSGVAPVTKRSGKACLVVMRYAAQVRLRQAVFHWARVAVLNDPECRGRYEALRARGHSYGRALRGVADRLLGVACVLLRRRTLFDPDHGAPAAP